LPEQSEFSQRRRQLLPTLQEHRVQAFVVTALPNVRYLSGFTGSNGALLLTPDRALLFTDPRYQTQAVQESDCEVKISKRALSSEIAVWMKRLRTKTVAFESNRISYSEYNALREGTPKARFKGIDAAVENLRMVKSPAEIKAIGRSVQLNSAALSAALKRFRPSVTETELAAEIDYHMRRLGADGTAFDTIVASGTRSALPHAHPTSGKILRDELLLIDMGSSVAGYASDMTRTFAVGKLDARKRRLFRAVLESQLAAIDSVKAGVACASVDRSSRKVLAGHGLDKLFIHSTGHGLGLEIHERPKIGRKERMKLVAGMVITIEPGVYDEAVGGVRIEDTVVVTERGCEILTPTRKELVTL
jgi:Xaa-Pro aminopeptidase